MKFAKVLKVFIFAVALILISSSSAFANTFAFSNESGRSITGLYFRESGTSGWGNNCISSGDSIPSGHGVSVSTGYNAQYWDIRVVYSNGSSDSWVRLDFYTNQKVTISRNGCFTSRA